MIAGCKRFALRQAMRCMAGKGRVGNPMDVRSIALWQFGGVGDMLLATPVIEALQKAYPDAAVHIWCSDPPFAEFLRRFPSVQGIHVFPVYGFDSRTLLRAPVRQQLRALGDAMAEQKPDMLVNLHVPALLDWWAVEWWLIRRLAPAQALGYDPRFMHGDSLLDISLNVAERDGIHYTRLYKRLFEAAGIACGEATCFPLSDAEQQKAAALLHEHTAGEARRVCMHIGARRLKVEGKMWPMERFAALAEHLVEDGFVPVLTGVQSEREMAEGLCDKVPQCVNLAGCTSLGEMAALIALCDGFIGHDSGPFHVAAAVGTPCVAICGRSDSEPEYLHYEREDVAVLIADAPELISVDAVLCAAREVINHG